MAKPKFAKNLFILGLLLISAVAMAAVPVTKVISPVAGTWANPQSLIVDSEPGTEVFYSLNGEDPLVSGFAYDGPVLLEGTGDFSLTVVSVSKEGASRPKTIQYSVQNSQNLDFINLSVDSPIVPMYKDSAIKMPNDVSWFVGTSTSSIPDEKLFQKGGEIALYSNCDIVEYIPLVIKKDNAFYRYVLKIGFSDSLRYSAPVPSVTGIEFFAWNYIRLLDGEKATYSIDDGEWKTTNTLIAIDRTKNHTIKWQRADRSDFVKVFFIPAKPNLLGVPEKGFTNQSVKLKLDSNDYQIGYNSPDGNLLFTREINVDTVSGDCASVSVDFDIYFQGIKQGSINPAFIIDRRNPVLPEIVSSATDNFSRSSIELNFISDDEVFYSVSSPIKSETGFDSFDITDSEMISEKSKFQEAENNRVILTAPKYEAVCYTVYAYAKDISGNCSEITTYTAIIDSKNFYVDSSADSSIAHLGTKFDPYSTIEEAIDSIKSNNVTLYLKGNFNLSKPVSILADCQILGEEKTRLSFTSNAQLLIENANVSIENCIFEKQVPQTGDVIQKNLFQVYDSTFKAKNCEFVCYFDFSGNCITAKNSSVSLEDSGLSVYASSYASAINAENSLLKIQKGRINSSAKTAVAISSANNSCIIDESEIKVIGTYTRACEFLSVVWEIQNSTFVSQNAIKPQSAIWMDSFSSKNVDFKNKVQGFTTLYVQSN